MSPFHPATSEVNFFLKIATLYCTQWKRFLVLHCTLLIERDGTRQPSQGTRFHHKASCRCISHKCQNARPTLRYCVHDMDGVVRAFVLTAKCFYREMLKFVEGLAKPRVTQVAGLHGWRIFREQMLTCQQTLTRARTTGRERRKVSQRSGEGEGG